MLSCTRCSTSFCFICGEEAKDGDGHWDFGMPCPRYHHANAENAVWDHDDEDDEEDENFRLFRDPEQWPEMPEHMRDRLLELQAIHNDISERPGAHDLTSSST